MKGMRNGGKAKRIMENKTENERKKGVKRLDERTLSTEKKITVRSLLSPFSYARTENGRLIWRFHE